MAVETYHRILLRLQSPWGRAGVALHAWSVKFSLSGAPLSVPAEIEATALDLFQPIQLLATPQSWLSGWSYYPAGTDTSAVNGEYISTDHPCNSNGWQSGGSVNQLEVCVLARAPVQINSKGKRVWLRKFIHDVKNAGPGQSSKAAPIITTPDPLVKWNQGSGPHNLIPISPTTGTQPISPWTFEQYLYTRQMRKTPERTRALAP